MRFDTDITAPALTGCDAALGRDVSVVRMLCSGAAGDVRPDMALGHLSAPAKAGLHMAALVCLPLIAVWVACSVMGRFGASLWMSTASLLQNSNEPVSAEDYVFNPADLYSGPCLAVPTAHSTVPPSKQAAFNHISTMVYLFRPASLQRPLSELMERPELLMEFFIRVSESRVVLHSLQKAACSRMDKVLAWLVDLLGGQGMFRLSSGLSPEALIPD